MAVVTITLTDEADGGLHFLMNLDPPLVDDAEYTYAQVVGVRMLEAFQGIAAGLADGGGEL